MTKILKDIRQGFKDMFELFFPRICSACAINLQNHEQIICNSCLYSLPKTNYHEKEENPVSQMFWGRTKVKYATAFYYFNKGSVFQKLIHKLKYKDEKEIGYALGLYFGSFLKNSMFKDVDIVLPVPLHPKKERSRGYNQSEWISLGISESMEKEHSTNNLYRNTHKESQTKKNRFERYENVSSVFSLHSPDKFKNKHVLLIDDVITTGSTIEGCIQALNHAPDITVSVATLAVASA